MTRPSVSWVSLVVGLVVALFFLVPTSRSFDVRERTFDNGRVEKSLQPAYRSLGSGLVIGSFRANNRLDALNVAIGVAIAGACVLLVELLIRAARRPWSARSPAGTGRPRGWG
jgi:hypothetical protein